MVMKRTVQKSIPIFLILMLLIIVGITDCVTTEEKIDKAPKIIPIESLETTLEYVSEYNDHLNYGFPSLTGGTILYRRGYVLMHSEEKKVPLWVSYFMTRFYLEKDGVERSNKFRPDPDLEKGQRAELKDYKKSGYDRGHMCPAGDMKRAYDVMDESFYLSNMCPQVANFNRGIWKSLESYGRKLIEFEGEAWIICGTIFSNDKTIGENKVAVPSHFYKILMTEDSLPRGRAFLFANTRSVRSLKDHMVTIDRLEEMTGLDFLNALDDDVEENVESQLGRFELE